MLSIQNNESWQTVAISINDEPFKLDSEDPQDQKLIFLLLHMMESIYFRLWDLVTQSKYKQSKKSKMKTELKRITIGSVERCFLKMKQLPSGEGASLIAAHFTYEKGDFRNKIHNYVNYSIQEEEMKPHFLESSADIGNLEYQKLERRLRLDDFDFSKRPGNRRPR